MKRAAFLGYGHYVPDKVVTNDDLAQMMDTSDEWIVQRTGIKERRYVVGDVGAGELAIHASKAALADAGITPKDVDAIIFATLSPDYNFPGNACLLQNALGCEQIAALDIRNQCSGFLYGLQVADAFIRTEAYRHVLLVGAEVHSTGLDFTDRGRDITVLFGDGAGACVIGAVEGKGTIEDRGVHFTYVSADGSGASELWTVAPASCKNPRLTPEMLEEGLHYPKMNGKHVFKWATEKMPEAAKRALDATHLEAGDIDWFVPHQANLRINQMVAKRMGFPEDKCVKNIVRYGNTTAATIPIGLSELQQGVDGQQAKDGDVALLAAFGSGFTWGSAVVRL